MIARIVRFFSLYLRFALGYICTPTELSGYAVSVQTPHVRPVIILVSKICDPAL